MKRLITYPMSFNFSLLSKVPKTTISAQQNKPWFMKIFTSNQNSVSFVLLKELFQYLENSSIIKQQFPYLKNTERVEQNCMTLHVYLLRQRITQQIDLPSSELNQFNYNLQAEFYPKFAAKVNPVIPTAQFNQHFAQAYTNKLQMFSYLMKEHQISTNPSRQLTAEQYASIFRKILYENRVGPTHIQLLKFSKYYLGHKKYLSMLEWNDIIHYKVKWGLQSLKFLGQASQLQTKNKPN